MLAPKPVTNYTSSSLFLEEPSQLAELDSWVEECVRNQQRFTFSEPDVLKPQWQEGEDIRLREDSRFREVMLFHRTTETQWRLAIHTVANERLYDLLLDELWDGHDLFDRLQYLDKDSSDSSFHIFALGDERFLLSQAADREYHLTLSANSPSVELTSEQKSLINQLVAQLLDQFAQESRKPWTTSALLEELRRLSHSASALEGVLPIALESWLLHQEEWVRVGIDSWLPKSELPAMVTRHRYAVSPVFALTDSAASPIALPDLVNEKDLARDVSQVVEEHAEFKESQPSIRWRVTLRTFHINEGILPVPRQARSFYPHARKLSDTIALPGLWFADASDITVWLDRSKHQLFGLDLQDQLAFLEAGTVLEMVWTTFGIRFAISGVDARVAEEETRLIDLTCLSQLRSTTMESYRVSLRAIMGEQNKALSFQEIYEALCERQQHKPNRATIRTILSSSPEFAFVKAERKWKLNSAIASEVGAKLFRRSILVAHQTKEESSTVRQETASLSLSQMVVKNRQRLTALRDMYLSDREADSSS